MRLLLLPLFIANTCFARPELFLKLQDAADVEEAKGFIYDVYFDDKPGQKGFHDYFGSLSLSQLQQLPPNFLETLFTRLVALKNFKFTAFKNLQAILQEISGRAEDNTAHEDNLKQTLFILEQSLKAYRLADREFIARVSKIGKSDDFSWNFLEEL